MIQEWCVFVWDPMVAVCTLVSTTSCLLIVKINFAFFLIQTKVNEKRMTFCTSTTMHNPAIGQLISEIVKLHLKNKEKVLLSTFSGASACQRQETPVMWYLIKTKIWGNKLTKCAKMLTSTLETYKNWQRPFTKILLRLPSMP